MLFIDVSVDNQMASFMYYRRRYALATDMALAALAGEGVYNFGEVLATPLLAELQESPNEYLRELVIALNQGRRLSDNVVLCFVMLPFN